MPDRKTLGLAVSASLWALGSLAILGSVVYWVVRVLGPEGYFALPSSHLLWIFLSPFHATWMLILAVLAVEVIYSIVADLGSQRARGLAAVGFAAMAITTFFLIIQ
jgi:hypothetical protein